MNLIFEAKYPREFTRNPFEKITFEKNKILQRTYTNSLKSCWSKVDKNGYTEFKSDFEPEPINLYNLCWFKFKESIFCFNQNFTQLYLLDENLNKKEVYEIKNPFKNKIAYLKSGHSSVEDEIPFLFGNIWDKRSVKYFSVLQISKENKSANWLHISSVNWLINSHNGYASTETEKIKNNNCTFPYRTYHRDTSVDDVIWDGTNFFLKRFATLMYHPQRPEYRLNKLEDDFRLGESIIKLKNSTKDFVNICNPKSIIITPNSFYHSKRKSNNQYFWNFITKKYVSFLLPEIYRDYFIHYLEIDNFVTLSKFDKENNCTTIINLDIQI